MTESVNLGAARELVEFSRVASGLDRLVLYSSVFVSGDRRGRVGEGELEAGQAFRNAAERSLALGERMVRRSGAPFSVIRAGHLLGDSSNGGIDRPSGPYLCVALVLSTPEDTPLLLPPFADALLPVTPVDYLAEVGAAAPTSLPAGRTVHAVEPSPLTLGGFIELLAELLGRRLDEGSKPSAVARALFSNPTARLLPKNRRGLLEVLTTGGEYATDGAMELSARGGPVCPPLTGYITRVVDHVRKRIEQGSLDPKGREEAAFFIA
jgi:hypothetical protein